MRELSLFSGVGGGLLGTKLLGFTAVGYVEWNKYCCRVLEQRIKDGFLDDAPIFNCDIREWIRLGYAESYQGLVDIITAGFPCFAAGTMVLTEHGYRPIEDVSIGDKVLTHLGRWRSVTSVMRKDNARVRTINAQGVPGVVTTDKHPFWTRHQCLSWDNAKRRYTREYGVPRWEDAANITTNHRLSDVLAEIESDEHSCEFWWIVGRYLADGWRVQRIKTGSGKPAINLGRIVICCAKYEREFVRERISSAGFHATEVDERTVTKFHIVDRNFYRWLEQFGRYAHGKRIPRCALGLDKERSACLFDGWMSGDGSEQSGKGTQFRRATTVSKSLALGMAMVARRAFGVVASVRKQNCKSTTIIESRCVNQRTQWIVQLGNRNKSAFIEGDYAWKLVRSNYVSGIASVYNISVDEDESYCADGAIVHNCQPFSVAGKQRGGADKQNMWPATIRSIRLVRPKYALLENVPGLLSYRYFGTILRTLADSGYDARWCVLSAAALGAPHRRNRLWILAESKQDQNGYANSVGLPRGTKGEFRWKQEFQPWQNNGTIEDICERFDIPSPLISGVGNGLADRVERTRATGNGQVPAMAAVAWTLLSGIKE